MFCKHKWTALSETITKSKLEVLAELVQGNIRWTSLMLKRKHIQIVSCDKCGKLHRFVESI